MKRRKEKVKDYEEEKGEGKKLVKKRNRKEEACEKEKGGGRSL